MLLALVACGSGSTTRAEFPRDRLIRVNAVQVRGTHNSYQVLLPPLERQLEEGVRQLELDVWAQPDGRFAVHHTLVDKQSTCPTLDVCLGPVRVWLEKHHRALPLSLIIEDKDATPDGLDALDAVLRAALPGRLLVRPEEVVGRRWPTLATMRGRVVTVLIGDLADAYSRHGTSLAGRAMLVYASSGPLAAITSRPDPIGEGTEVASLVKAGLVVRTQADGDNFVVDEKRRAAAVDSGAQIVSARDDAFLLAPGTSFRCDPLVPSPCRPEDLEHAP